MAQEFVPRKQQRQTQTEKGNFKFSVPSTQIKMCNLHWRALALSRPNQGLAWFGLVWFWPKEEDYAPIFRKDLFFSLTELFLEWQRDPPMTNVEQVPLAPRHQTSAQDDQHAWGPRESGSVGDAAGVWSDVEKLTVPPSSRLSTPESRPWAMNIQILICTWKSRGLNWIVRD